MEAHEGKLWGFGEWEKDVPPKDFGVKLTADDGGVGYLPSVCVVSAGFGGDGESSEEAVSFEGTDESLEGAEGYPEGCGDKPHIGLAIVA